MRAEQAIKEKLSKAREDWYWYNICDTAMQLCAQGLSQSQYITQYASGKCLWKTELDNEVLIAPSGQFPNCLHDLSQHP